jgi:ribosomal protein L17
MRHARGYRRLNRTHEHRKAMFANMAGSLIEHEQIKTTLPKAKELKSIIEKLVTLGKRGDEHARRQAMSRLKQHMHVTKLFDVLMVTWRPWRSSSLLIATLMQKARLTKLAWKPLTNKPAPHSE